MAQRLVKVAKELNVGTTSIVEHLISAGFEIENKPSAKITEEMYSELLKEFHNSLEVKEKADQLILGSRQTKEEVKPTPPPPAQEEKPAPVEAEKPVEEAAEAVPEEEVIKAKLDDDNKPKVKVLGKIDLDPKPKKAKKEEVASGEEAPAPEGEAVKEKQEESSTADQAADKEVPSAPEEEVIRAETPQLKGLKILGKIDAEKLEKPKKKEPEAKPAQAKKSDDDAQNRRKRKRTRKKVEAGSVGYGRGQGAGGRRGREEQVKEVTQKEIEENIKATMARLSGGGKSKRQKIRRDKRDEMREKEELKAIEGQSDKIQITEFISVSELASLMNVGVTDVITTCMNLGVIVSINQRLDAEIIELLAEEFGHEVEFIGAQESEEEEEIIDDPQDLVPRAPIVTVMGHVDHGKTSLLDYVRNASVVEGEAGGITQHIGAYEVAVGPEKKKITFLDTPGHEAFTAMRARGAKVTDVVVVIVAADDRVMPQTKEAISHATAAGVPIVFAINKVDKPGANPEKIKEELSAMNFLVEDWGGKYQSQDISAKTGQGIEELLDKILLESELLELKANPDRMAQGTVIEASLDKGRGYVTKLLVQTGTLKIGDPMFAGEHSGRVKAMFNDRGKKLKEAGPSTPVLILGLSGAPQAGEKFRVMESEPEARQVATKRAQITREQSNRAAKRVSLDEIGRRLALGSFKELNLVIKGDVDGSIEALSDSLIKLSIESVAVNVIHKAVGAITESDVLLATASDAIIVGFQVRPTMGARNLAEKEGVQIKTYSIIYEAIDEIKSAIEGMLEPTKEEKIVGQLEVRETFKISKVGTIAGCIVQEGYIKRSSNIRLIRDGIVIYPVKEGQVAEIGTLKRFKDDVREVKNGMECGLTIKNFNDLKVGDNIEVYEIEEIKQTLD